MPTSATTTGVAGLVLFSHVGNFPNEFETSTTAIPYKNHRNLAAAGVLLIHHLLPQPGGLPWKTCISAGHHQINMVNRF
jgi:hypothetical protein